MFQESAEKVYLFPVKAHITHAPMSVLPKWQGALLYLVTLLSVSGLAFLGMFQVENDHSWVA